MFALLAALAAATELRAAAGGQIDAEGHGMADLVFRGEDWAAGLLTDTVDARWTPEGDRGKGWLGGRVEGFAAGLMISPWEGGRPVPERALGAAYAGIEAGAQRYLRHGFYAGVEGHARAYAFFAMPTTEVPVPGARPVVHLDGVLGWYRPFASAKLRPGVDLAPGSPTAPLQPHLALEAQLQPEWTVAPRIELRAGWAEGQDAVTLTRLGGLTPYNAPLGGAAWAEWWVEDHVAVRAGPQLSAKGVAVGLLTDAAWFDGQTEVGFALDTRAQWRRLYADVDLGYAPWIPRPDGQLPLSVWFSVGLDWGPLKPE